MFTDFFQRTITDVGLIGPDRARGGLYLLLPPDYDGQIPQGYFAFKIYIAVPTHEKLQNIRLRSVAVAKRARAPSSLQNIRLSSDWANPLNGSRNGLADGDGCVEFAPDAGVAHGLRVVRVGRLQTATLKRSRP